MSRKNNHVWSFEDNLVALYYHRFGTRRLGMSEEQIVSKIGTTVASLKMQSKNFEMLYTGHSGLSDYSKTQSDVFNQFGNKSSQELFNVVSEILGVEDFKRQQILEKMGYGGRKLKLVS